MMVMNAFTFSMLLLILLVATTVAAQGDLAATDYYDMATTGQVALILDVRTQDEWNGGHLPNATFVEDMGPLLSNTPVEDINATLKELGILPCLSCPTVVYCRSGARAAAVIDLLRGKAGFITAELYNGPGVYQWVVAGYKLNTKASLEAPCMKTAVTRNACPKIGSREAAATNNNNPLVDTATETPPAAATTATPPAATTQPPPQAGGQQQPQPQQQQQQQNQQQQQQQQNQQQQQQNQQQQPPPSDEEEAGPAPQTTQQKEAPTAKCGTVATERGRGGVAAESKDCARQGNNRHQRRNRGLRGL